MIRIMLLGIKTEATYFMFFLDDFAIYAAVSLIAIALGFKKIKYLVATVVLAPIFAAFDSVYLNLRSFGFSEYLTSYDFQTAVKIIVFASLSAFVASLVVIKNQSHENN